MSQEGAVARNHIKPSGTPRKIGYTPSSGLTTAICTARKTSVNLGTGLFENIWSDMLKSIADEFVQAAFESIRDAEANLRANVTENNKGKDDTVISRAKVARYLNNKSPKTLQRLENDQTHLGKLVYSEALQYMLLYGVFPNDIETPTPTNMVRSMLRGGILHVLNNTFQLENTALNVDEISQVLDTVFPRENEEKDNGSNTKGVEGNGAKTQPSQTLLEAVVDAFIIVIEALMEPDNLSPLPVVFEWEADSSEMEQRREFKNLRENVWSKLTSLRASFQSSQRPELQS